MEETNLDGLRGKTPKGQPLADNHLPSVLARLFPNEEWMYGEALKDDKGHCLKCPPMKRITPDARCEALKLIIEIDGDAVNRPNHYADAVAVAKDRVRDKFYASLGYRVVRIPMYVQLDAEMVRYYFGIDYPTPLYKASSMHGFLHKNITLPSSFCQAGFKRFLQEYKALPKTVKQAIFDSLRKREQQFIMEGFSQEDAATIVMPNGDWTAIETI